MVQRIVALGRYCQSDISIYEFHRSDIVCNCMWRSDSRISDVDLPQQRSLCDSSLYFCLVLLFALPDFRDVPEYLSHRFAKPFDRVVLRAVLRRMFERRKAFFAAACNDGLMG